MTTIKDKVRISENFWWIPKTKKIKHWKSGAEMPDTAIETAIDVYDDRQLHWFLEPLERFVSTQEGAPEDFIVVATLLAYFEGSEQFRKGKITPQFKAREWFAEAAARILSATPGEVNSTDTEVKRLWKECRCGLFHSGFTYSKLLLNYGELKAVSIEGDYLVIDPHLLLTAVQNDHKNYVFELRANPGGELRKNFQTLWKRHWANS